MNDPIDPIDPIAAAVKAYRATTTPLDNWPGYRKGPPTQKAVDAADALKVRAAIAAYEAARAKSERRSWFSSSRWRHRKRRSEYEVLTATAEAQCSRGPINEGDRVTVYQADDGSWWIRKTVEFQDGRFERIDLTESARAKAEPQPAWRPIETAPPSLILCKGGGHLWIARAGSAIPRDWFSGTGFTTATHWAPIPEGYDE